MHKEGENQSKLIDMIRTKLVSHSKVLRNKDRTNFIVKLRNSNLECLSITLNRKILKNHPTNKNQNQNRLKHNHPVLGSKDEYIQNQRSSSLKISVKIKLA